ncbi:MAG: ThiF family adenylyltransferase [Pseudolabrys sp.]|jgi:integrative and conjugative element protein (TIGR02256 family)
MTTEGQASALAQLREISDAANGQFEIVAVQEPSADGSVLAVEISVDCSGYTTGAGGLSLRPRERFVISVPAGFPLDRPDLTSVHTRFAGFPHVQWGSRICLYQAPESEWRPDDGMYGFVDRVDEWLRHAACGEFDPVGFPLHPPVAYASNRAPMVIPRVNTPRPEFPWWAGYAEITAETEVRAELGRWIPYDAEIPNTRLAVGILLPADMPFEYPTTIKELERVLAERNVQPEILKLLFEMAALRNGKDKPIYLILGAAMRGVSGDAERLQHLACWFVNSEQSQQLYTATLCAQEAEGQVAAAEFAAWAEKAIIRWCEVREERPEIAIPRDRGSPLSWWRGHRVTILGCGAIGSVVAMLIARARASKIRLYDNRLVAPGVLARQNYDRRLIGYTKVSATKVRVQAANPDIEVEALHEDAVNALRHTPDTLLDADVVINATASTRVAAALEQKFRDHGGANPPIASMVFGSRAEMALMTYAARCAIGVTIDLDRRAKIAFANAINGRQMLDEFWPAAPAKDRLFQPEPGCSDPTFVGSAADTYGLSSIMLNVLSQWLGEGDDTQSRAFAFRSPTRIERPSLPYQFHLSWKKDVVAVDSRQGYQLRISEGAKNSILGWISTSRRRVGAAVETGGLLFGQIDEFLKVVWIDEVSGPPPDSVASPAGFVCGIEGTADLNNEKIARSRGSIRFVGMWHTHPGGMPNPSCTDLRALTKLWKLPDFKARHFLMLILGGVEHWHLMAGHMFERRRRRS